MLTPSDVSPEALRLLQWLAGPNRYGWLWAAKPPLSYRCKWKKVQINLPAVGPVIERREHEEGCRSIFVVAGRDCGEARRPWRELTTLGLVACEASEIRITETGRRLVAAEAA